MADDHNSGQGCVVIGLGLGILALLGLVLLLLPHWLGGARKARQTEARFYIESLNRAQQAYYLEQAMFAADITNLEIGLLTETGNYVYATIPLADMAVQSSGMSKVQGIPNFVGLVWVVNGDDEPTTQSLLCKSKMPAHEPETSIFPSWLREIFVDPSSERYPPEAPPQFELPELPASSVAIVFCPDGYEVNE